MGNPARRFSAAVGVTQARWLTQQPPFIRRGRARGRFAVGVRYEREVQEHLSDVVLGNVEIEYKAGPWIEFQDKSGRRWCQPDALLISHQRKLCTIAEVKYQHTADAWFQLEQLYRPVVQVLLPGYLLGMLEIVHWHDPQVCFPQPYDMTDDPFTIRHSNRISVHIWNPKRGGNQSRVQQTGLSRSPSYG